jgi:lipopolysaccharide transport protein LptA
VNRFPDNPGAGLTRYLLAGLVLLLVLPALPAAGADTGSRTQAEGPDRKIRITADRLVANTKTGSAEFIGNVRAAQGSTVITSDRLEVLYDQAGKPGAAGESAASIESIVSTGNVVIHFDDKVATTDKAVYRSQTGVFTLTGKGTRVTSGNNAITGDKITVDRKNDRMTVESGEASRVNAVIFTGKDGLSQPAKDMDNGKKSDE